MRAIYRKVRRAVRECWPFDAIGAGPSGVLAPGRRHTICQPICRPSSTGCGKLSSVQRQQALP